MKEVLNIHACVGAPLCSTMAATTMGSSDASSSTEPPRVVLVRKSRRRSPHPAGGVRAPARHRSRVLGHGRHNHRPLRPSYRRRGAVLHAALRHVRCAPSRRPRRPPGGLQLRRRHVRALPPLNPAPPRPHGGQLGRGVRVRLLRHLGAVSR
jgi:hypothetical protein